MHVTKELFETDPEEWEKNFAVRKKLIEEKEAIDIEVNIAQVSYLHWVTACGPKLFWSSG